MVEDPTQLDFDAIQLIFDHLEFPDLLNAAEVSKDFSFLAMRAFQRNFAQKKIIIANFTFLNPPNRLDLVMQRVSKGMERIADLMPTHLIEHQLNSPSSDFIRIESVYVGLKTLKHFGKFIRHIEVTFEDADSKAAKLITQYVNEYCGDTLIEFGLDFKEGDALQHIQKPFKNVQHLRFVQMSLEQSITWPTHRMFPALRNLQLEIWSYTFDRMQCHLPHLKYLSLTSPGILETALFDANPEIQSFTCNDCDRNVMNAASEKLPRLVNLTIFQYHSVGDEVRFENVRELLILGYTSLRGLHLKLPKLQKLQVLFDSLYLMNLVRFLGNHMNLTHFHLNYKEMSDSEFQRITSSLPNLEEMIISSLSKETIGSDSVVKFIESHDKLMKFTLNRCQETDKIILRRKCEDKWLIQDYDEGLSFQRRI